MKNKTIVTYLLISFTTILFSQTQTVNVEITNLLTQ